MTLSTRLTRAGAAFIVFGLVASALPTNTAVQALPTNGYTASGGRNNTGAIVAAAAVGGGLFAFTRGANGLFPYGPGHKGHKRTKKDIEREQFNKLDRFTRPSDAGSNPNINH